MQCLRVCKFEPRYSEQIDHFAYQNTPNALTSNGSIKVIESCKCQVYVGEGCAVCGKFISK
jgi:hypothetical protein